MVLNLYACLISAVLSVTSVSELDALRYAVQPDPQQVAEALQSDLSRLVGTSRAEQCMNAFIAGELYRKADALVPGQGYADKALEYFRAMRVEYLDLAAGQMGYIGESRVHRQRGDAEQALEVLKPLLELRGDTRIKRLAQLEALEAWLLIDPRRVLAESVNLGASADWARARAYAELGEKDKALELARSPGAKESASVLERLGLIASLDGLTEAERREWIDALIQAGRTDEAIAAIEGHIAEDTRPIYAELLQNAGRYEEAAEAWQAVYEHSADPYAAYAWANCLEVLISLPGVGNETAWRNQAVGLYRAVIESDAGTQLKTESLKRWFYLSGTNADPIVIRSQSSLIESDPYLTFAAVRVLAMHGEISLEQIKTSLEKVLHSASDEALRATAALMLVHQLPDKRQALAKLDQYWSLLSSHPDTAQQARVERISLWLALGMVDIAVEQVISRVEDYPPDLLLRIAEALSHRHAEGIQADARDRAVMLIGKAMSLQPDDTSLALRAGRLLARMGATSDALAVLESLHTPDSVPVLAEVLRNEGRQEEALKRLADVDSPYASLQRGYCLLELDRPDEALVEARRARSNFEEGGDDWWRATMLVIRAYAAQDNHAAAGQVLRVSQALYPIEERDWLRRALEDLKQELGL